MGTSNRFNLEKNGERIMEPINSIPPILTIDISKIGSFDGSRVAYTPHHFPPDLPT